MSESLESEIVTPETITTEPITDPETTNTSVSDNPPAVNETPATNNDTAPAPDEATAPDDATASDEAKVDKDPSPEFQKCQTNLELINKLGDLKIGQEPIQPISISTDLTPIGHEKTENNKIENYQIIGINLQGNLICKKDGEDNEFLFSKTALLKDARNTATNLINSSFESLDQSQQNKITEKAHSNGFIMAQDLQSIAELGTTALGTKPLTESPNNDLNSPEYKRWQIDNAKWQSFESILNSPVVNASNLKNALNLMGIPYSADSMNKNIQSIEASLKEIKAQLKNEPDSDKKNQLQQIAGNLETSKAALENVKKQLGKEFGSENWDLTKIYEQIENGESDASEFYENYFASLLKDNKIDEMIDKAQLSAEKKMKIKEKALKSLKIGGGIIGVLMILMLMQGMGGGGGQAG